MCSPCGDQATAMIVSACPEQVTMISPFIASQTCTVAGSMVVEAMLLLSGDQDAIPDKSVWNCPEMTVVLPSLAFQICTLYANASFPAKMEAKWLPSGDQDTGRGRTSPPSDSP